MVTGTNQSYPARHRQRCFQAEALFQGCDSIDAACKNRFAVCRSVRGQATGPPCRGRKAAGREGLIFGGNIKRR